MLEEAQKSKTLPVITGLLLPGSVFLPSFLFSSSSMLAGIAVAEAMPPVIRVVFGSIGRRAEKIRERNRGKKISVLVVAPVLQQTGAPRLRKFLLLFSSAFVGPPVYSLSFIDPVIISCSDSRGFILTGNGKNRSLGHQSSLS